MNNKPNITDWIIAICSVVTAIAIIIELFL